MMEHCDAARLPRGQNFTTGDFWQALLATAWVTGMRKSALFGLAVGGRGSGRWERPESLPGQQAKTGPAAQPRRRPALAERPTPGPQARRAAGVPLEPRD